MGGVGCSIYFEISRSGGRNVRGLGKDGLEKGMRLINAKNRDEANNQ
jgi:hypothetical protein